MRFSVLGPLSIHADAHTAIHITAARQRTVLAALLLRANQAVSNEHIISQIWDAQPPPTARATPFNYVSRLRRTLGPDVGSRLLTRPGGLPVRRAGR